MAQFIPFEEGVEVAGQAILGVVNALGAGGATRFNILKKHGLSFIQPEGWYSQQAFLNAFKEIAETFGVHTLFAIGEAVPENAIYPPEIDNLEKALTLIDRGYHLNHRGGEIGHYILTDFDPVKRMATMVCNNPYPSEFDRGLINAMVKKFLPPTSLIFNVHRDVTKETRLQGADSCTFKITW